jgi:hypothetical protein
MTSQKDKYRFKIVLSEVYLSNSLPINLWDIQRNNKLGSA